MGSVSLIDGHIDNDDDKKPSTGTDLIIVCRNKKQAKDLYEWTCRLFCTYEHPSISDHDKLYVKDTVLNDSARFVTVYELKHKHFEDGLNGVRIEGDFFDKWLDGQFSLRNIIS